MSMYFEHLLTRIQARHFAISNHIILFFELVVLLSSIKILPTDNSQTAFAVNILNGVVSTDKVLLHTGTLDDILDIGGEEGFA